MLQHAPPVAISTDEAQAVFELWARRRQDAETRQQMPTTRDLAEAMGISEDEVMRMLREVRMAPPVVAATPPQPKPRKKRWKFFLGLVLLAGTAAAFYAAGARNSRIYATSWMESPPAMATSRYLLPKGLTADYRGYTLSGQMSVSHDMVQLERDLYGALNRVVQDQTAAPLRLPGPTTLADLDKVRKAMQEDKISDGLENILAFEPLHLRAGTNISKVMIPMALSADPQLEEIVRQEVERRLRVAANKGARIYQASREPVVAR